MSRRARYIVGCSFGKDSLATVITAVEHGEPLDEAVYCEVMFDEHISGEVPEHRDFIYEVGIPALKSMGIKTTVLYYHTPGAVARAKKKSARALIRARMEY